MTGSEDSSRSDGRAESPADEPLPLEKRVIRRGYDELGAAYAAHRWERGRSRDLLESFLGALEPSARVLDAGCGPGTPVLVRLAEETDAVGFDLSRGQLRLAADRAPAASLLQGDMTTLPCVSGTFDAVVAYWSLIHVPMADHRTVLEEFARVLRPGGRLLVCEGTTEWAGDNPDWLERGVEMQWHIAGAETTATQLRAAGFRVVDRWGVPEELDDGDEEDADHGDDGGTDAEVDAADGAVDAELPWTVFSARFER